MRGIVRPLKKPGRKVKKFLPPECSLFQKGNIQYDSMHRAGKWEWAGDRLNARDPDSGLFPCGWRFKTFRSM
jgi:hypothetical protein